MKIANIKMPKIPIINVKSVENNSQQIGICNHILKVSIRASNTSVNFVSNMLVHVQSIHLKIKNYSCNLCNYQARRSHHLAEHINNIHKSIKHKCDQCEKEFTTRANKSIHVRSVHEQIKFSCTICDYKATQKSSLTRHIESVHQGVKYNCIICGYDASSKGCLIKHTESLHKGRKFQCKSCSKEFNNKSNLSTHTKAVHEGRRFICDLCNKSFKNLNKHKKLLHSEEQIQHNCNMCTFKTIQRSYLRKHILNMHQKGIRK